MSERKLCTVLTHQRTDAVAEALVELRAAADRAGYALAFTERETTKHRLRPGTGVLTDEPLRLDADLCVVLGGDGTILSALRAYAGTGVPVYAVNYGQVGFLATVDPEDLPSAFRQALAGEFERLSLPAVAVERAGERWLAFNDVSIHRMAGNRVAELAYALGADEIGRVRCDGLVVATPAGSTGYNLANGGPVLAWGVAGFVVSFIAPHSLTARALVVAPGDELRVFNDSRGAPVDVHVDGRPRCELPSGGSISVAFEPDLGVLAQMPGATFYHRLRDRFGRLSS